MASCPAGGAACRRVGAGELCFTERLQKLRVHLYTVSSYLILNASCSIIHCVCVCVMCLSVCLCVCACACACAVSVCVRRYPL